jgi:hypothetical protein
MASTGRSHVLARASPSRPRARGKGGRSTGTGRSGERGVAALLLLGVTALAISGLTSTYLPRLVVWRQGASCVPGDETPCPPETHHPDIDVVSVAVKPTCVTRVAIASINQYVAPRFIRFVSADADACATLVAMARNVRCTPQDEVIPGVTKDAVKRELERLYHGSRTTSGVPERDSKGTSTASASYLGRERAGWYLQQLIKLGVARHLPDLTSTFLVWDPDMIALEPFKVFSSERSGKTGKERVVRHVGGYAIRSYEDAYKRLTNEPLASAPDGSSYVTHAMTFERAFLEELLGAFADAWEDSIRERADVLAKKTNARRLTERITSFGAETVKRSEEEDETFVFSRGDARGDGASAGAPTKTRARMPTWARAILASLNPEHLDLGFSEYASYASWVATHHPETVEVVPHRAWTRHPLGPMLGSSGIRILRRWSPVPNLCCPSAFAVRAMKLLGYSYGGFEVGHVRSCGYDKPEHERAYGLGDGF